MLSIEGLIVNSSQTKRGRIEIDQTTGLIAKICETKGEADFVFTEELIFPGFIDLHVHARECVDHSQDHKEDFISASQAAVNGGVVAFLDMPNNLTPPIDDKSYDDKNLLTKNSVVPIVLYAGIGNNTKPLSKKVPYKVFMGHSIGELFFTNQEDLEKAIAKYSGENVSFHCEDPKQLEENKNASTHEARRPASAEISAVDFALYLIEKYKINGKICHASTIEAVRKITEAKNRGVNVTVEITPHHLFFDETMPNLNKKDLQVNPPIRQTKENRLALIEALSNGGIDFLATDHAPHTMQEKEKGISGMPHLDTFGPFTTWLIKEHGFTAEKVARVCSVNPGVFFNQFSKNKYGELREGFVGSLTVIDMSKPITINQNVLKTKCGWSPFSGVTFPGSVVMTMVNGKIYDKR
ncbi:MAG: amidohydrolase family protein [Candidatus Pacebacteria bacterium]|nr:amidohydrolase family protein [Candidatus Paceibacterota bacterium]